jgi:Uma2 family endonuclease
LPDQAYYRPEHQSNRGAECAELVVEIRSKDETYDKIGFYAQVGVREMLIVHLEGRWIELLPAVGSRLLPVTADTHGVLRSEVLGAQFATVGGRLRITWQDGTADI